MKNYREIAEKIISKEGIKDDKGSIIKEAEGLSLKEKFRLLLQIVAEGSTIIGYSWENKKLSLIGIQQYLSGYYGMDIPGVKKDEEIIWAYENGHSCEYCDNFKKFLLKIFSNSEIESSNKYFDKDGPWVRLRIQKAVYDFNLLDEWKKLGVRGWFFGDNENMSFGYSYFNKDNIREVRPLDLKPIGEQISILAKKYPRLNVGKSIYQIEKQQEKNELGKNLAIFIKHDFFHPGYLSALKEFYYSSSVNPENFEGEFSPNPYRVFDLIQEGKLKILPEEKTHNELRRVSEKISGDVIILPIEMVQYAHLKNVEEDKRKFFATTLQLGVFLETHPEKLIRYEDMVCLGDTAREREYHYLFGTQNGPFSEFRYLSYGRNDDISYFLLAIKELVGTLVGKKTYPVFSTIL